MSKKRRWLAMLSIASLFIAVGGCSDDDDIIPDQQVNQAGAEAVVEEVLPEILTFGPGLVELVRAVIADKAGDMSRQPACDPIPGIDGGFFCADSADGVICPVDVDTTEWQFDNCEIAGDEGTLDGTVTVDESGGNTYVFTFDLLADGDPLTGVIEVVLSECANLTYDTFVIEVDGTETTLNGTNDFCEASFGADIDATVSAPGIVTFLMDISTSQLVSTIVIVDGSTMMPLYLCTYVFNPATEEVTGSCMPYMGT